MKYIFFSSIYSLIVYFSSSKCNINNLVKRQSTSDWNFFKYVTITHLRTLILQLTNKYITTYYKINIKYSFLSILLLKILNILMENADQKRDCRTGRRTSRRKDQKGEQSRRNFWQIPNPGILHSIEIPTEVQRKFRRTMGQSWP